MCDAQSVLDLAGARSRPSLTSCVECTGLFSLVASVELMSAVLRPLNKSGCAGSR